MMSAVDIGVALRAARRAMGLTQAELAEATLTSRRNVVRWETGERDPSDCYRRIVIRWASQNLPAAYRDPLFDALRVSHREMRLIPPGERAWWIDPEAPAVNAEVGPAATAIPPSVAAPATPTRSPPASPEDATASPEDATTSPEAATASPKDAPTPPEDAPASPEDAPTSPEDATASSGHAAKRPIDDVVRASAEQLDVTARAFRAALGDVLDAAIALGTPLATLRELIKSDKKGDTNERRSAEPPPA